LTHSRAMVGALNGLNMALQEAPDLPMEVKVIVDLRVNELLAELASLGVG
jgi:hypothetical protein